MDTHHALANEALDTAFDLLQAVAAELALASAQASSPALRCDARLLAEAVEREALAASSISLRHA